MGEIKDNDPDRENSMGRRYKVQEFKRLKLKMGGERN